ncbi:MAG: LCP family protein [Clostridia bacterium]|nr:LCP family protein [Clostridia bacterium]MBQ5480774.1 LCP family protein [Clostridia bacterium]
MDEKLTPADVLRKGIDAVADAENKGINVEKDAETQFSLSVDDDAVEFSSFSIDDNRDTTPGSKAGTRLPTVSMPSAKVLSEPDPQATMVVELPEDIKVSPAKNVSPINEPEELVDDGPIDIYSHSQEQRHSRTWIKNHEMVEANEALARTREKAAAPAAKTQEELLAEILADTPEERRRKEAAQEEGRRFAEDIFSQSTPKQAVEEPVLSEPTRIIDTDEMDTLAALEHFTEESRRERRARMNMAPEGVEEEPKEADISFNAKPGSDVPMDRKGYFGVGRKSGFSAEAVAGAAGGKVIESRSLAVDPTTLTKKELREYNRINKKGEKARKKKGRLRLWQRILLILLALILLVLGSAAGFFGRYYGLLGNLDLGDNPIAKIVAENQSEANEKSMNILLVGLDSRKDNYTGRSDSMILCTINKKSKKFVMTSFLRDSYVTIPGHGKDKLNAAYALGGSNLLANTIYENYGIVVDRTAVFNFLFVIDIIDYLGGVTVDVTADELPYLNMYIHDQNEELYNLANPNKGQIHSGPGTYTLDGNQALGYARIRYVGTDVARSERQRLVLSQCIDKCKKLSTGQLNEMMTLFLPRIKTDLTSGDCLSLITTLLRAGSYESGSMAIPTDGTWKDAKVGDQEVIKITDFDANTEAWEKLVS